VASISSDPHLLTTSQTNFLVSSDFSVQHDFFYDFFKIQITKRDYVFCEFHNGTGNLVTLCNIKQKIK